MRQVSAKAQFRRQRFGEPRAREVIPKNVKAALARPFHLECAPDMGMNSWAEIPLCSALMNRLVRTRMPGGVGRAG